MEKRRREQRPKLYEDKVIDSRRVIKVTKGGRTFSYSSTVAVGDLKGRVGLGIGKANEPAMAIDKAKKAAVKNMIKITLINGTISHEAIGHMGASRVLLKPAVKGTGFKAGGPVRAILELAGVTDIVSKSLGSNTKTNVAHATIDALKQQKTREEVANLRGLKVEDL